MKSGINLNLRRRDCNIKELEISIAVFFTMQGLIMWVYNSVRPQHLRERFRSLIYFIRLRGLKMVSKIKCFQNWRYVFYADGMKKANRLRH